MDITEYQDSSSICHAALRLLQDEGIDVPKPVKTTRCGLPKEVEERRELFGVCLVNVKEKEVVTVDGHVSCLLPKFFANSLSYLEEFVSTEGLFRKSGSVARQREIKSTLEEGGTFPPNRPHDVAALLKSFLRQLPEPLMTRRFGQVYCQTCSSPELTLIACLLLPLEHLQCLQVLMRFLKQVAMQSDANKMDTGSLAVVLAPNLFDFNAIEGAGGQQMSLTAHTAVVESLIQQAEEIGKVPPSLADKAYHLSKEYDGNLPPLLLTYIGEEEADLGKRTRRRRTRKKSASFSDIMKGLGNSISRLRKISPKDGGVASTETPKLEGNASVARKDSVKRRAESVSDGTNAKRRAVHESPPSTPVIKGKKKRNFFRRRQSSVSKTKRSGKMQGLQRSSSVDLLLETEHVGEPSGCPETSPHVMTGVRLPSEEESTTTPKTDKVGSSSEEETQREEIDFSSTSDTKPPRSRCLYQVVTSDGTIVRCLSKGNPTNTIKYSEVKKRRIAPTSSSTLDQASSAPGTTSSEVNPEDKTDKDATLENSSSSYNLRSSNALKLSLLPSKMPIPSSAVKSKSDFNFVKSAPSPTIPVSQPYDFSPYIANMCKENGSPLLKHVPSNVAMQNSAAKLSSRSRHHSTGASDLKRPSRGSDNSLSTTAAEPPLPKQKSHEMMQNATLKGNEFRFSVPETKEELPANQLHSVSHKSFHFSLPEAKDVGESHTDYFSPAKLEWGSRSSLSQDCCFQPPASAPVSSGLLEEISMEMLERGRSREGSDSEGVAPLRDPFLLNYVSGIVEDPDHCNQDCLTSSYPLSSLTSAQLPSLYNLSTHPSTLIPSSSGPQGLTLPGFQHIGSVVSPNISVHSLPRNWKAEEERMHTMMADDMSSRRSPSKLPGTSPGDFVQSQVKRLGNQLKSPIVGVTNLMTLYTRNSNFKQAPKEWLV